MNGSIATTLPLARWQGEKAAYHLLIFTGEAARALAGHALMHRLEQGQRRGFGSVKVAARIGATIWHTSVFPQQRQTKWVLLVGRKVMREENLAPGDEVDVELSPL